MLISHERTNLVRSPKQSLNADSSLAGNPCLVVTYVAIGDGDIFNPVLIATRGAR